LEAKEQTMTDTQPVTTAIAVMIASGTTGQQIVAALVRRFPDLTLAELSEALQAGTTAAERHVQAAAGRHGVVVMAFTRDEILKAWDEAIAKVAQIHDNPTDEEIDEATAIVCAKCPGATIDDIREALRADVEDVKRQVASADRALQVLKGTIAKECNGATLPRLPSGRPLKQLKH
jgi:uncharacterized protein (DUF433 family)